MNHGKIQVPVPFVFGKSNSEQATLADVVVPVRKGPGNHHITHTEIKQ